MAALASFIPLSLLYKQTATTARSEGGVYRHQSGSAQLVQVTRTLPLLSAQDIAPAYLSEPWRTRSLLAISRLSELPANWDGYGSRPPTEQVRAWARNLILGTALGGLAQPEFGPESDGGLQIDWWSGKRRELEIHVHPDNRISFLKVEEGNPVQEGETSSFAAANNEVADLMEWLRNG